MSIGKRGRVNGGKGLSVRRMDKGGQKREGLRVRKMVRVKREEVMGGKRGRVKGGQKAEWLWVGKGEGCEIGEKS